MGGDRKIVFVYNANSGMGQRLWDAAHKFLSPHTYTCDLCTLTHGPMKEKKEWREFRERQEVPLEFLHKDEYLRIYGSKAIPEDGFPAIMEKKSSGLVALLDASDLAKVKSVGGLIQKLEDILKAD